MSSIHIIGGGLSGLAAAITLANHGRRIIVYEAASFAGGRCRSYFDAHLQHIIDNGNHLILGANTHALAYIRRIGAENRFISRQIFHFRDLQADISWEMGGWSLVPGCTIGDYIKALRLLSANRHDTVTDCIDRGSPLYQRFIEPFCIAALNTPPHQASAWVFRHVLWQLLKSCKSGLHYYTPKYSLANSLIDPAIAMLQKNGVEIRLNSPVKSLDFPPHDEVIIALPSHATAKLFPEAGIDCRYNAIVNGHFLYPEIGNNSVLGLIGGTAQWIFCRDGIISTTTSAANDLATENNLLIAKRLWADVQRALKITTPLPAHRIICEKRATHACLPHYFPPDSMLGRYILAGDYLYPMLPATIDSTIKSGFSAGMRLLLQLKRNAVR